MMGVYILVVSTVCVLVGWVLFERLLGRFAEPRQEEVRKDWPENGAREDE